MLTRIARSAGIDGAVFFTLLNKGAVILSTGVTLLLVIVKFSPTEQGYYYTFTSLLVLQTLLELGMGVVLVQFLSHEWTLLAFSSDGRLQGDDRALARVAGLVNAGVRWYALTALTFFVVVGTAGYALLARHGSAEEILWPWVLLCAGASLGILQTPLRCLLDGSNQVARSQKLAMIAYCTASVATWIAILAGLGLYSLAVSAGVAAVLGLTLQGRAVRSFLALARSSRGDTHFSWREEFWPLQWRISISFVCGFCMFQSFVPILYFFRGPIAAGQMGASLQIYHAVNQLASAWINARGPRMGMLGARGQVAELKAVVDDALKRSRVAAALCGAAVLIGLALLTALHFGTERFVGLGGVAVLLAVVFVIQQSNVETLAIRFQKSEPFVANSVVSAVLVLASNVVLSLVAGPVAVCAGFALVIALVTTPWVHRVYRNRIAWLAERSVLQAGG